RRPGRGTPVVVAPSGRGVGSHRGQGHRADTRSGRRAGAAPGAVERGAAGRGAMSRGWSSLEPRRATGVIVRRVPVRVADISATGCMLESGLGIREGAVGTLHLTVEGRRYRETLRVTRVTSLPGSGRRQQVGAQFLTLGASRRA